MQSYPDCYRDNCPGKMEPIAEEPEGDRVKCVVCGSTGTWRKDNISEFDSGNIPGV